MPELPEVETTRRGIREHLLGRRVENTLVRQRALRWPVPEGIESRLHHSRFTDVTRRGKYLLLHCDNGGTLLIHLGMSGNLRIVGAGEPAAKHDHIDVMLNDGRVLRFTDPRRFGCVLWLDTDPLEHPLLEGLGPEPLGREFDQDYLYRVSRRKTLPVKSLLMDNRVVVGVGNIYANEALFMAGIHPARKANGIARARYQCLGQAVREVLAQAIEQGGTTLKDFVGGDGKPGYFKQELKVYGRAGQPCRCCTKPLKELRIAQRATVFCPSCQR